jgi:hypothetical protein
MSARAMNSVYAGAAFFAGGRCPREIQNLDFFCGLCVEGFLDELRSFGRTTIPPSPTESG